MKRFLAAGLLFGATFAFGQKGINPDNRIYDQVRLKLANDPDVKGGALDVTVQNGVVTLKGRVDSEKGKSKATHVARKVKGVKQVDNELSVGPPQ